MLTREQWTDILISSAAKLKDNEDRFSQIDSIVGDGDHGITMTRIADIMAHYAKEVSLPLPQLLENMGWEIVNVQGGSAGPLWGTFFMGMSKAYKNKESPSVYDLFQSGLQSLQEITQAKVGDKTMMDAIYPAIDAMAGQTGDVEMLDAAAGAAKYGARHTKNLVAKYGRAKNYGERSAGVEDAGAVSAACLIAGMADAVR